MRRLSLELKARILRRTVTINPFAACSQRNTTSLCTHFRRDPYSIITSLASGSSLADFFFDLEADLRFFFSLLLQREL
jgi:hypothetical protein